MGESKCESRSMSVSKEVEKMNEIRECEAECKNHERLEKNH